MTLAQIHSSIYLPKSFYVLGTRLLPFTLGHSLALQALDLRQVDSIGELALATLVCSLPPGDMQKRWGSFPLGLRVRLRGLRVRFNLAWLYLIRGPFSVISYVGEQTNAFWDYCDHYSQSPQYRILSDSESVSDEAVCIKNGAPFLEHLLVVLKSKLNYSESEAMGIPLNQAMMRYLAWLECEGRIEIMDDTQLDECAALAAEADIRHAQILEAANRKKT